MFVSYGSIILDADNGIGTKNKKKYDTPKIVTNFSMIQLESYFNHKFHGFLMV